MISPTSVLRRPVCTADPTALLVDLYGLLVEDDTACRAALLGRIEILGRDPSREALRELLGLEAVLPRGKVRSRAVRVLAERRDTDPEWQQALLNWTVDEAHRVDDPSGERTTLECRIVSGDEVLSLSVGVELDSGKVTSTTLQDDFPVCVGARTEVPVDEAARLLSRSDTSTWLRRVLPRPVLSADLEDAAITEYYEFDRSWEARALGDDEVAREFVREVLVALVRETGFASRGCSRDRLGYVLRSLWRRSEAPLPLVLHQARGVRIYLSWLFGQNDAPADLVLRCFAVVDDEAFRTRRRFEELIYDDHTEDYVGHPAVSFDDAHISPRGNWRWHCGQRERSDWEQVVDRAGGIDELLNIDVYPLPAEALDVTLLDNDIVDRVTTWSDYIDEFLDVHPYPAEVRTACRRLLVDVAAIQPKAFHRQCSDERAAAGIILAVFLLNGMTSPDEKLVAFFSLNGPVRDRASGFLDKLGLEGGRRGHVRYLLATQRERLAKSAHVRTNSQPA